VPGKIVNDFRMASAQDISQTGKIRRLTAAFSAVQKRHFTWLRFLPFPFFADVPRKLALAPKPAQDVPDWFPLKTFFKPP
jgi:hypothetical protein